MADAQIRITRDQLAEFLPNSRVIKAFEDLFNLGTVTTPIDITILTQNLGETNSLTETNTASINAHTKVLKPDYSDYSITSPTPARKAGRVHYGSRTLNVHMSNTVEQDIGLSSYIYVKATTSVLKGQVVYKTGVSTPDRVITVSPTPLSYITTENMVGIAAEDIAIGEFGYITVRGLLLSVDTTGTAYGEVWADGDSLWYNSAFVGGLTKTMPVAPNQKTFMGEVIEAGVSGSLLVRVTIGTELGRRDSNVQITAPANGNILQYDSALTYWKNVSSSSLVAGSVANALTGGTYITSTGTFDGSVARTFAVDATSVNTASKVVARDGSGNFAAGRITAAGLTSTETIIPDQLKGIVGTTTNNSANVGSVGEIVTAIRTVPLGLVTATATNVTSMSLTAGQWTVFGAVDLIPAGGTSVTDIAGGISITSATFVSEDSTFIGFPATIGARYRVPVPTVVLQLSGTTTVYLVSRASFTVSTLTTTGKITAVRAR